VLFKSVLLIVVLAGVLPYGRSPIYSFPTPSIFAGSAFLNPYANLHGTWQRANLHAHGRAWGGLTNGRRQSDDEVARRYRELGYSVAGVSDYHRIAAHDGVATMPIYEHGYDLGKHHQLAIGARRVEWFDFPLWQSLSHEQFIIDRVRQTADLVALAHPSSRDAYSPEDLQLLTGYQLLEVLNGPFPNEEAWDAALSSGHAVWAVANDDSHDLSEEHRIAVAWNMIDAPSSSTSDVVAALGAGRTYAVARSKDTIAAGGATLASVAVSDGTVVVTLAGAPSTFTFVGQNGEVRKTVEDVTSADYTFTSTDTYIRTVIRTPSTTMYLNPLIRYDGVRLPAPAATIDTGGTWLLRLSFVLGGFALILILRRRRPAALAPTPQSGLGRGDRNVA